MLRYFITISFVLFSLSVFSQVSQENSEIKISKPYKVIDAPNKYYFSDGKEILLVKTDNNRIILQKFDAETLEMNGFKEIIDLPYFSCEKVVQCRDKLYFFYSVWDKPNTTEQLFVKEINFKNCDISSEGTLLLKVKGHIAGDPLAYLDVGPMIAVGVGTKFHIRMSDDKSKILIHYRMKPEEKDDEKNYDIIGAYIIDLSNELKTIGHEFKMPYSEAKMDQIDYLVTNEGSVFFLIAVIDQIKKSVISGHHEVLKMDLNSGQFKPTEIHIEEGYFSFSYICEDLLNKIVCMGHHHSGPNEGISYVKLNPNGSIIDTKTFFIPDELLYKKKNEKVSGLKTPIIDKRLNTPDSGMVVLEEQVYTEYVGSSKSGHFVFKFDDIFISKITSYGKLDWVKRIPKLQGGATGIASLSYMHFMNKNFLFTLFLENKFNINKDPKAEMAGLTDGKGGYLVAYKTNLISGETVKIPLFDITNLNQMELLQFSTKRFCQINESELVIEAYKGGKQDMLIKIHFN